MSITSEVKKVIYSGDDVTTSFPITFPFFETDEIEAVLYTIADGSESVLTETTDYSIIGGDGSTGTLNKTTALADEYQLIIRRKMPMTQEALFSPNDPLPTEVLTEALDRAAMRDQQLLEQLERAVLRDPTQTAQISIPTAEANKLIGWNPAGTGLENKESLDADVQAACEAAQVAAEAAQVAAEAAAENAEAVAGWEIASQAEAEAGSDNTKVMTPLRVMQSIVLNALKKMYPIGSVYSNASDSTNPATLFGFGTWSAIEGVVLVGYKSGDPDFGTVGAEVGVKTVTLTAAQSGLRAHSHTAPGYAGAGAVTTHFSNNTTEASPSSTISATNENAAAAASEAHTNIQPSRVVYAWRRTA